MREVARRLGVLTVCASAAMAADDGGWRHPELDRRLIFTPPERVGETALIRFACGAGPSNAVSFVVYGPDGGVLRHRVLAVGKDGESSLLVALPRERTWREAVAYGGAAGGGRSDDSAGFRDSVPVRVDLYPSTVGRNIPNTWPKLSYLISKAGRPIRSVWSATFLADLAPPSALAPAVATPLVPRPPRPPPWSVEGRSIAHARTLLWCPLEGVYRFALNSPTPAFLFVDGERYAEWPHRYVSDRWQAGAPRQIEAGPHWLELYTYAAGSIGTRIGWQLPGEAEIAEIPEARFLSGTEVTDFRVENRCKPLHAAFRFMLGRSYAFKAAPYVFTPVQFRDASVDWLASALTTRWDFGDGNGTARTAEGTASHTYATAGCFTVTADVRDELGFTARCARSVDCRRVFANEYAVDFRIGSLPSVCYGDDVIEPYVQAAGAGPEGADFVLESRVLDTDGNEQTARHSMRPRGSPVRQPLCRRPAGRLLELEWRVVHAGARLAGERVKFRFPPFADLPARVEGDRLYDARGDPIVLVPHRHSGEYAQPAIRLERSVPHILCLDDFLATPSVLGPHPATAFEQALARGLSRSAPPVVKFAAPPSWEQAPGSLGPLTGLVEAGEIAGSDADLVVLSVGLWALLRMKDAETMERWAAAMSDIVGTTRSRPVLWVTPPPYPPDPERVRPFAAAVRRVADARRMPVADLYTAFRGAGDDAGVFFRRGDLALSDRGQALCALVIARALRAE